MFRIKQWMQEKKAIYQNSAGLQEKREAAQRTMDVAMTILREFDPAHDRRIAPQPHQQERRHCLYEYHRKLA